MLEKLKSSALDPAVPRYNAAEALGTATTAVVAVATTVVGAAVAGAATGAGGAVVGLVGVTTATVGSELMPLPVGCAAVAVVVVEPATIRSAGPVATTVVEVPTDVADPSARGTVVGTTDDVASGCSRASLRAVSRSPSERLEDGTVDDTAASVPSGNGSAVDRRLGCDAAGVVVRVVEQAAGDQRDRGESAGHRCAGRRDERDPADDRRLSQPREWPHHQPQSTERDTEERPNHVRIEV